MSSSLFSWSKRHNSSKEVFSCLKLLVVMHIRAKMLFTESGKERESSGEFVPLSHSHFPALWIWHRGNCQPHFVG